jgi:hypothetical protein
MGMSGFGSTVVYGNRRVPLPPHCMTAFIFPSIDSTPVNTVAVIRRPDAVWTWRRSAFGNGMVTAATMEGQTGKEIN